MNREDVLRHIYLIRMRSWAELNNTGRYLLVRCQRALERELGIKGAEEEYTSIQRGVETDDNDTHARAVENG